MLDFCGSFFSMDSENLRYSYATLTELTPWSALTGSISDSFHKIVKGQSEQGKALQEKIENSVQLSRSMSDQEICLHFLAKLCEMLEIPFPNLASRQDCVDLCSRITVETIKLYRARHPGLIVANADDLVKEVIKDMFGTISRELKYTEDLDGDLDEMVRKTEEYLASLPREQQEEIRRKLGIDEINQSTLKKLLTQGSAGALFAIAVDVAGFSAYLGAVKALSSISKLVGVTLPFSMYTTLTSAIAVLANPLIMASLIGAYGVYKYQKQSKEIKDNLLPMVVSLIMLQYDSSYDPSETQRNMDATVELWQSRLTAYKDINTSIDRLIWKIMKEKMVLNNKFSKCIEIQMEIKTENERLKRIVDEVANVLRADRKLVAGLAVTGPGSKEARECCQAWKELSEAMASRRPKSSSALKNLFHSAVDVTHSAVLEAKANSKLKDTAQAVVDSMPCVVPPQLLSYSEEVRRIRERIERAQARVKIALDEVQKSEQICKDLSVEKLTLEKTKADMEMNMPMLKQVYLRMQKVGV